MKKFTFFKKGGLKNLIEMQWKMEQKITLNKIKNDAWNTIKNRI